MPAPNKPTTAEAVAVVEAAASCGLVLSIQVDTPGVQQWWATNTSVPVSIWFDTVNQTYRVNRFARRNRVRRWACVYKGRVLKTVLRYAASYVEKGRNR